MAMKARYCHKCKTLWESELRQPGFKESCTRCGAYLHCCKNCRYHVPTAHNQCYIPDTEYVADRAGLNFCEEFAFREGVPEANKNTEKQRQARNALADLFGDDEDGGAPTSFDDLFKA